MKLHLNNPDQVNMIRSCERTDNAYKIQIEDEVYTESLILTLQNLDVWSVDHVSQLKEDDFLNFSKLGAEVILLGTGENMVFLDIALTRPLINQGIGLEVMNTAAACRTYNIMISDGRKVAAGLILPIRNDPEKT